jgi:uracil-DNA glycosylase family 4
MITRCSLCPGVNACIGPDGPDDADVLFIGEAPGYQENKGKRVFIGKTGDEVNRHYLPLAGLRRDSACFANAISCLPISNGGKLTADRAKDIALLETCAQQNLYPLIERSRFRLLVPLGSFACQAVCPEVNLELQHGFPVDTAWGIPAFPMYHPALGIHEPKKMLMIRNDWQRLRQYLKGTLVLPVDEYPNPDYQEVTDASEIQELDCSLPLAGDTESTRQREPYCLTYSVCAGTGRLIRANRRDLLAEFQSKIESWEAPILFHNWLYDWPVTEAMGLRFPHRHIVDTMSRVFHLGNLPQGLKALASRELGMEMQDFEDVVTPYSRAHVLNYYEIARLIDWPKPEEELVIDEKTGLWKLYKPQGMNTKLKRFFTDYGKAPDTKDVFAMWEDNWVEQQAMIEAEIGKWPGLCISHVPFEKVLYYACRDVDALIRLYPVLTQMRSQVRHTSQEHWRTHAVA